MSILIKGDNNGIAVDGDLTIEHLDFTFGKGVTGASAIKQTIKDEVVEDAEVVEMTNAEAKNADSNTPRGPRKKFLFALDGIDTKEDETVKRREKERFCKYLSKHCLKNRQLVCTKNDTLNKTIVCFLLKWMEKGLTAEAPSSGAIFRFLTEDCGIVSEVQEKAYCNRMKEWIKDKNGYDTEVMLKVKVAF